MSQDKPFVWKSHWKQLGWKVGWGGASGNHQDEANSVNQVAEVSDRCPPASSLWGGLQKGTVALPAVLLGRMLSPSSPPGARHFSSYPYASGAFEAAAPCWSLAGVSLSKFVYGPFKRSCLWIQEFLCSIASIPIGFHSQKSWGLTFLALEPWAVGLVCGTRAPHSWDAPPSVDLPHMVVGPARSSTAPPASLNAISASTPWLWDFRSSRFLAVLNNGCCVV